MKWEKLKMFIRREIKIKNNYVKLKQRIQIDHEPTLFRKKIKTLDSILRGIELVCKITNNNKRGLHALRLSV